jgi:hypothetical protein
VIHPLLAAIGKDFDDPPVGLQPHPHHGFPSRNRDRPEA